MRRLLKQPESMQTNNYCLIISHSARALAESAAKAGIKSLTIDCFADEDTCKASDESFEVERSNMMFDSDSLRALLGDSLLRSVSSVIPGGGFVETCSRDTYDFLNERWVYLGSPYAALELRRQPLLFTEFLRELEIPAPTVSLDACTTGRWLLKDEAATGGQHVSLYHNGLEVPCGKYLQEYVEGRMVSINFLANGETCRLLGINDTFVVAREEGDFRYAGAVTTSNLSQQFSEQFEYTLKKLTRALQLRGLCGMDAVIKSPDEWALIEINMRPTATFELHENEPGLILAHTLACRGIIPEITSKDFNCGQMIVYAPADLIVRDIDWPSWISDRPREGRRIRAGEPVCTIRAAAESTDKVRLKLEDQWAKLKPRLYSGRQAA